jgi:hypothetical protein
MLPSMKKQIIINATVDSVADAHGPLSEYGFAIVRDMTEAFAPKNRCTREQRDFITQCKSTIILAFTFIYISLLTLHDIPYTEWPTGGFDDGLEHVFEGVIKNSVVDHLVSHYDSETLRPRYQLNPEKRSEYNTLYKNQLHDVIEGYEVYEGEETPISFESTVSSRKKSRPQNKNMVTAAPTVVRRVAGLFATGSEQAKFSNWKAKQQVLKGGNQPSASSL